MLIKFKDIVKKYDINPKGILHIGAHHAEEAVSYLNSGVENVIWVEADSETFKKLNNVISKYPLHKSYCFAASNIDGDEVGFHVASNGESSSMLEMETHLVEHPQIKIIDKKKVKTKRVDTFLKENSINIESYNFLNLDIQGAELLALKGVGDLLNKVSYIYTEVNESELYKNCAKINEIDEYLFDYKFKRVETKMTKHGWGDAFYIKK